MSARVEVLTYVPTEFHLCQQCELVWNHVGFGQRWHAEQRRDPLPGELQAEYAAIAGWVRSAFERYGDELSVRVVDAASVEGVWMALRHRARRFPAFVIDGRERILGLDCERLDFALAQRISGGG